MITKADIGKLVIVNGERSGETFKNEKGKIVRISNDNNIGIEFQKERPFFHACKGSGKYGYCWYVTEKNITFEESKKMTGIRIETEKMVRSDNKITRKITGFKALKKEKLPEMYWAGERPIVHEGNIYDIVIRNKTKGLNGTYRIGEIIEEEEFQKLLAHCKESGDHLADVNRELAKKREEWNGVETFII